LKSSPLSKHRDGLGAATFVPTMVQLNDEGATTRHVASWHEFGEDSQELLRRSAFLEPCASRLPDARCLREPTKACKKRAVTTSVSEVGSVRRKCNKQKLTAVPAMVAEHAELWRVEEDKINRGKKAEAVRIRKVQDAKSPS
jgi:hypothetical protein